ncbi:hypothetical protein [Bosea sp. 685]|uniref:hypothetical protein n=1 Tax=Bosea sp. 685 TaxID=3080057 RepID=UPI002892AA32|nr:hypothetical protein [Bosea sp. 685]WNJ94137.1 hypothetical protein RMR04_14840 [Bosea sp. 685]
MGEVKRKPGNLLQEQEALAGDARLKAGHDAVGRLQPALSPLSQHFTSRSFSESSDTPMRPEIQTQLDNAKQSIGLLRRHL